MTEILKVGLVLVLGLGLVFIVEVTSNLKVNKSSCREELVKHITSESTEFDGATCYDNVAKVTNKNKQ